MSPPNVVPMSRPAFLPMAAVGSWSVPVSLMFQLADRMICPFWMLAPCAGGANPTEPPSSIVSAWFFGTATM